MKHFLKLTRLTATLLAVFSWLSIWANGGGSVTVQGIYYGQCERGTISGTTEVCNNDDIIFVLDAGFAPTVDHDDVEITQFVVGDFGSGPGNPLDEDYLYANMDMDYLGRWDDATGRHERYKLRDAPGAMLYDRLVAAGRIKCRISYEWKGSGATTEKYYTEEKYFWTDKDPVARMTINGSNATWIENGTFNGAFMLNASSSESCGEGYTIALHPRDYWGNGIGMPWVSQSFTGYPGTHDIKTIALALGQSWDPGDNYAVRINVHGNGVWTDDIHFIRIKASISDSKIYAYTGFRTEYTPNAFGGQSAYTYFENTNGLGQSFTPFILLDGTASLHEDRQYISIREFDPLTWTASTTLYQGWWCTGCDIWAIHALSAPPFNATFTPGKFYMITHAVGPQWDADYHLMKVGPWKPHEDDPKDDPPTERSLTVGTQGLSFDVYPNPSTGQFNINTNADEAFQIEVTDLLGKTIYQQQHQPNTSIAIRLSNQPKGIYLVSLIQADGKTTKKLVIQ